MFVCNKWDQIDDNTTNETEKHIIKTLQRCLPNLDSQSQVVKMSTVYASYLQKHGIITEQFSQLIAAVKSMMLKTMTARLERDCR